MNDRGFVATVEMVKGIHLGAEIPVISSLLYREISWSVPYKLVVNTGSYIIYFKPTTS